ncbi:MAG: hypothetical protein MAG451_03037 [Anaerolineales bacterium]|nr:hypothetical protein [Anaerolineales bacterium]
MKEESVRRLLRRLEWSGGLTRSDIMRQLHDLDDPGVDVEGLYLGLVGGRVYFGIEEVIDSIPRSVWEP